MNKFLLLFVLVGCFSLSIVSADSWSYDNSYSYGDADAYARVSGMYPECEGSAHGNYCVGKWYVDVSHRGDKFWVGYRISSWSGLEGDNWDEDGYDGSEDLDRISNGRLYPNQGGEVPNYILCAWDKDTAANGDWAWTAKCGGYIGSGMLGNKKNIACSETAGCGSSEYCDMSGDWRQWKCDTKECDAGETKCDGYDHYICTSSFSWENKGTVPGQCDVECLPEETTCKTEVYYQTCGDDYQWIDNGILIDQCSVECLAGPEEIVYYALLNSTDCTDEEICTNYKCQIELPVTHFSYSPDNECRTKSLITKDKTPNDYLTEEECLEKIIEYGTDGKIVAENLIACYEYKQTTDECEVFKTISDLNSCSDFDMYDLEGCRTFVVDKDKGSGGGVSSFFSFNDNIIISWFENLINKIKLLFN